MARLAVAVTLVAGSMACQPLVPFGSTPGAPDGMTVKRWQHAVAVDKVHRAVDERRQRIRRARVSSRTYVRDGVPPSGDVWERLAQCESGGRWDIDSQYDGGLQFHPQTWRGHGGEQYAPYAYQATREEQIAVAQRVQQGQGWGAWPVCSRKVGLR